MELYRGAFLEKDPHKPWSISFRERLREKFIQSVSELGSRCKDAGEWEKAIDCYQRGLEIEELAEEFYYNQMTCYKQLSLPAKAILVYRRCYKVLFSVLGIKPSSQTKALYETIKSA